MSRQSSVAVRTVAFEVIEKCNLFCEFCVRSSNRESSGILSSEQFSRWVHLVTQCFPNLGNIALTGGEPFLHPELVRFTRIARCAGHSVCITTNGTVHRQNDLEAFLSLKGVHIIVSIDGPNAAIHDMMRGLAGVFDRVLSFAMLCQELGLVFLVNMTVTEKNYLYVYETAFLAWNVGALDLSVALVKPQGRGRPIQNADVVFTEVGRQIMLAKRDFEPDMNVRFTDPLAHIIDVSLALPGLERTCGAGSGALHVQCDGTVLLCTSSSEFLGNIEDLGNDLAKRVRTDPRLNVIAARSGLGGACNGCDFVKTCGGCRCRASKTEEGFLGPDPLCPKNTFQQDPLVIQEILEAAIDRLKLDQASDPPALRTWLEEWKARESFTRKKLDFLRQRRWGHNIDLGHGLFVEGEMKWRHITILRRFLEYGTIPTNLADVCILDIGAWTGGEALLLAALGARVDVYEESPIYRETIEYLADQFRLPVRVAGSSMYVLAQRESLNYDYVYLTGILSHLSDIVVALRIAFNHLANGGLALIETQTSYSPTGEDEFWGPSREGWVWFNPSRLTILEALKTVGFRNVRIVDFGANRRFQLSAQRIEWLSMPIRSGLSIPDIP